VIDALNTARHGHSATLLPNGKVLVTGGFNGSVISSSELYSGLPRITGHPTDVALNQGKRATFHVTAIGGDITYQWQKDGTDIMGATNATFILNNAEPANAGTYSVVVTNLVGSVTSNPATLTVYPDADYDGLTDAEEIDTYHTNPNKADSDDDGLSDIVEIRTYGTNPMLADTDGDGFLDGYEVLTGKSPLDIADHPALVAEARTAIEFTFPSALGKTYRIEGSPDLATWTIVEDGISGNGAVIQRFYSTRDKPKQFLRVEEGVP
jgi:hypothetical protein